MRAGRRIAVVLLFARIFIAAARAAGQWKPYRVLLIIGNQWKDPRSFVVNDGGDFQHLVTLLKSWGIPFDILRLDQQKLDEDRLADAGMARFCGTSRPMLLQKMQPRWLAPSRFMARPS